MAAAVDTPPRDRRRDPLMRDLVQQLDQSLSGFQLDERGSSGEHSWVRFQRPARDSQGYDGALVVLVAHGRRERAVMVDVYFVDAVLDLHTPHRKLLHRYSPDVGQPHIVRDVVEAVHGWQN